mmetsp:Transcript_21936/g.65781  ORF Transcript_21936/g.65781 Transcript_21936/m.65781 type:complete len:263 (+) Transcript_21936:396-1184(+)
MRSTSWRLSLPPALSAVMVMRPERPEPSSRASMLRIPFASMSNVTLTRGTPRGAGAMPESWKSPSSRLSLVRARSPSKTLMSTPGWLSWCVEKTRDCLAGMVVLRSTTRVMTPPAVSMPRDRGATSNKTRPPRSPFSSAPARTAACTAAPYATASSGFREQFSVREPPLPSKNSMSLARTRGTRVEPPTSTTSSTSFASTLASLRTRATERMERSKALSFNRSKVARVTSKGPKSSPLNSASTSTVTFVAAESSFLALSQAR